MNANANNRIPFDPNPELFRKSPRNGIIKKTPYNELKLEIIFFGEIELHEKKYYRYAFYIRNGKENFLLLEERTVNRRVNQIKNFITNNQTPLLTIASRRKHPPESSPVSSNIPSMRQQFSTKRIERTILHVRKINKSFIKNNDLSALNKFITSREEINIPSNINHFQTDPNGITLPELTKNNRNSIPFKIIRKSKLSSFQFNEPHVLFEEININGKKYYRYACYKSKGPYSVNGVLFRELKNVSNNRPNNRPKTIMNSHNSSRTYLYFIGIENIERSVLIKLLRSIEKIRINTSNKSFLRTIYKCVSDHVDVGINNNSVRFSNNESAMQLQEINLHNK